jgi:hypothetical protein
MTNEEIIEMAKKVKMPYFFPDGEIVNIEKLERFAKLIAEAEREACAKVCDDWPNGRDDVYSIGVSIRARGQE